MLNADDSNAFSEPGRSFNSSCCDFVILEFYMQNFIFWILDFFFVILIVLEVISET